MLRLEDMRLSTVLPLVVLSLAACAEHLQEDPNEAGSASETSAAVRAGLTAGMYGGEGALLVVTAEGDGLRAIVTANEPTGAGMTPKTIGGRVALSQGKLAIADARCPVGLDVEADQVKLTPEPGQPGDEVQCLTKPVSFRFIPVDTLAGDYTCVGGNGERATATLRAISPTGSVVVIVPEVGAGRTLNATFRSPSSLIAGDDWLDFVQTDRFFWMTEGRAWASVCTLVRR